VHLRSFVVLRVALVLDGNGSRSRCLCYCVASVAVLASLGACHTARMAYGAARGGGGYMCAVSHILPYGAARWAVKRTGEGTKNRAQQYKLALRQRVIKFNTCYSNVNETSQDALRHI
jgi:hypothetical protein